MTRTQTLERPLSSSQPPLPAPDRVVHRWIDDDGELARSCAAWRDAAAVGLDTEFVRERTYYAQLGLIQVGAVSPGSNTSGSGDLDVALIDPRAVHDLSPLGALLDDPSVVKILHSPSEDLEIFHQRLGAVPRPLFDTQIAAALTGHGWSLGFGALVAGVFGIELPKGQTRSNWLRRPLSPEQLRYAALDVAYLPALHGHLERELERLGRRDWLREEMEPREDSDAYGEDDLVTYRKLSGRRAGRRQLGVLRALSVWREREARRRDLPRNFIVPEQALGELAAKTPRNEAQLRSIKGLGRREISRHGRAIVHTIREALALSSDELPEPVTQPIDLSGHKDTVRALRDEVERLAARHRLPPELLATRRSVESTVRRRLRAADEPLPDDLLGWRREIVGEPLLRSLETLGVEARPDGGRPDRGRDVTRRGRARRRGR